MLLCVLEQPRVDTASAGSLKRGAQLAEIGPIGLMPCPSLLALSADIICQCCLGVVGIEVVNFLITIIGLLLLVRFVICVVYAMLILSIQICVSFVCKLLDKL